MKKILVVEDEKESREIMVDVLREQGYTVFTAENGRVAIDVAQQKIPDLIIMNVKMPELDGSEAMKIIRANPETKNIPILFSSAFREEKSAHLKNTKLENADFIVKPYNGEKLSEKVRELLKE